MCQAKFGSRGKCHRLTSRGYLCRFHARKVLGVRVGPSTVIGAGLGLFATREFHENEVIEQYKGPMYIGNAPNKAFIYGFETSDGVLYNPFNPTDNFTRFINDGILEHFNNCQFVERAGKVFVKTIKKVRPGEEFFVSYGPRYWQ